MQSEHQGQVSGREPLGDSRFANDGDDGGGPPRRHARSGDRRPLFGGLAKRVWTRGTLLGMGTAALSAAIASAAVARNGHTLPLVSERDRIAHLLRRAGFGYSQEDLDFYLAKGLDGAVEHLVNYDLVPDELDARLARVELNLATAADLQRWWLLRMIYTKRPLQENMALFWHGLLVSGASRVGLPRPTPENPNPPHHMLNQNAFFRDHALDDFPTIVKGISRDPAMVIYLDSRNNRKGRPNENYARELMELFTLGIDGPDGSPTYTEQDVREAARAFTGWSLDRDQRFVFSAAQHDSDVKTVFGVSGKLNGDDVIDLIMSHPACAPYVCRRLFSFFAYDQPEPSALSPIVDKFLASGRSIRATVQAIFTSPAFYSERAYRAKTKAPVEYLAGISRALRLETDAFGFNGSAQRMGQALFDPPNVAGWPGGAQWFNSTSWLERVNQLNRMLSVRQDPHTQAPQFLPAITRYQLNTPEKLVDYYLALLVDGQVAPERRQVLVDYARLGSLWPPKSLDTLKETDPAVDRKVRGLVYLIMAMPEFHLA
jgi:uncharacterized protein (DUF1800 family)